jgi:hypothetical protein
VHLIAIPLRTSHTGSQMAQLVDKVMVELCGNDWKANLIGISTDGARNMTGKWRGAVTLLAEGTLPGFFRVWCAAHQLDLVVQDIMSSLCSETFYTCLTSLISHLRRQQKIVAEMKSTCPTVSSTRWSSLDLVCKWLSKNGDTVINQARSIPDLSCTHVHVCSHNFILVVFSLYWKGIMYMYLSASQQRTVRDSCSIMSVQGPVALEY